MDLLKKIWSITKIVGISIARFFKYISLKIARFFKTISIFIWNKIKSPTKLALVLFYLFFVVIITTTLLVVIKFNIFSVLQYVLYVLSTFSLAYFIYTIVIFVPKLKNNIITILKQHKFTNKLLSNYGFRSFISSCFSFAINFAYVIFQCVLAIISKSFWYASIAVYYLILTSMKGNVFLSKIKDDTKQKQLKTYRFTGILYIFLTIALSGIIILIYKTSNVFEYAGLAIYVVAAYTFFNLSMSIYNLIKSRKQTSLYVQNLKNINLVHSVFSLFVLQVALFQAFSPESNTGFANALTGGAVSLFILTVGILMIVKSSKTLKHLNSSSTSLKTKNTQLQNSTQVEDINENDDILPQNTQGELNEKL